ncbi:hypothetical protein V7087_00065 [Neobacillus niacini]|uniref:hypothetical protein n=1 Tax=Neobacillus niacini TaxID=86668 RepID=UPI002FFEED1D
MATTNFQNKDHGLSSFRTSIGSGKNKVSLSHYFNSTDGGVTFRAANMTTRINNQGQTLSSGFKTGRKMTYLGSKNGISNRIAPF